MTGTNYMFCWPSFYQVDWWNSDAYRLDLQFSIRETVCTKASGRDPFTCDFKIGPFVVSASGVNVKAPLLSAGWACWNTISPEEWRMTGFLKTKPNPSQYNLQHGVGVRWEVSVLGNSSAWSVGNRGAAVSWKEDACLGASCSISVCVLWSQILERRYGFFSKIRW